MQYNGNKNVTKQQMKYIGNDEKLNGVVSLVIVFEELSHVTSSFWSRARWNRESVSFTNRIWKKETRWFVSQRRAQRTPLLYIPDLGRVSGFHLFVLWTFLFVPWTLVTLVKPWERNEFPTCIVHKSMCYYINWLVLFSTKYSVLLSLG